MTSVCYLLHHSEDFLATLLRSLLNRCLCTKVRVPEARYLSLIREICAIHSRAYACLSSRSCFVKSSRSCESHSYRLKKV